MVAWPFRVHVIRYVHLGLSDAARHVERDLVSTVFQLLSRDALEREIHTRLHDDIRRRSDALPVWICSSLHLAGL